MAATGTMIQSLSNQAPVVTLAATWTSKNPTAPMKVAPANAAAKPAAVTPPDVPTGTGRPVVNSLGWLRARTPSSVAHVSALAVASAP